MSTPLDNPKAPQVTTPPSAAVASPQPPRRPMRLTSWFALLSLLCIGAVSIVSSILLSRFLTANLLEHDANAMTEVVQSLVDVQDAASYFTGEPSAHGQRRFEEFIAHISRLPDVLRTNIYARDQRVLWSSDPALIGRVLGPNRELEEALEGHVHIETGVIDAADMKPEHRQLRSREPRFVENYLPVRGGPDRRIIGVVEFYRVPTALFDTTERGVRLIWISALVGGALLYAVLYGLVRRADRVIDEQSQRLLETETLAIIGEMTGAITHGIRNPLASIRTSAELLSEDGTAETRGTARDIMAEVDRLSEWVRQLLTYSSQEPTRLCPIDVADVLSGCLDGFRREFARRHVHLEFAVERPVRPARAEAVRLAHVFNSLIANAVEAMPDGGQLDVSVGMAREGGCVRVEIRDTGSGIAADQLPRVFVPFFTTKRKGLGLGLPLVKRIITRFGGSVSVASATGEGARVELLLPVY